MATGVGSISVDVKVTGNLGALEKQTQMNVKNALKAMADATIQRTQILDGHGVPIDTGELQSTGIVEPQGEYQYAAQFGNGLAYARYQEFAPDGWNYTTPGTGNAYLKTAGDSVVKEGIGNYL